MQGEVVKLDRGFPLVRAQDGRDYRCEHATALVKDDGLRAVIGDRVVLGTPEGHDKAVIEEILPRRNVFVRKDPTERATSQVLAANFECVLVAQPLAEVNLRRLERELVLAFETGAQVAVVLTKADLAQSEEHLQAIRERVQDLVGSVPIVVVTEADSHSVEAVRALIPAGTTAVLIGRSGVGKSSLINVLVGEEVQATATVRATDGKGRHTTVAREMIEIPGGGRVIDMPGVRGMGLWDAHSGMEAAFADVEALTAQCRFRDCKHINEPGCAVQAAVAAGELSQARLASYQALAQEIDAVAKRREEADRLHTRTGHPRRRKG
ncbi:MAG: ribosome small subunit-dependent GTPase A [Raoultibacter sp.]